MELKNSRRVRRSPYGHISDGRWRQRDSATLLVAASAAAAAALSLSGT